ncbi:hypothetical protein LX36DRAFT_588120 [Colletotrichum falcatum]|nr:hypothetical protein LX36DRAFT_588120 [Colletotrichum falcatum]
MKYTAVICLLVSIVAADTINELVDQIPTCAVTCIRDKSEEVGCDITNFACSCGKIADLSPKVVSCLAANSGCSDADQSKVFQLTPQICAQVSSEAATTTGAAAAADSTATTSTGAAAATGTSAAGNVQAAGWAGIIAAAAVALAV